jgi:UDP-N-acetyl-D-mannosaminuronic acid dehydrogenase
MINIIGLGYIGLPTVLMFAKKGVSVVGTDYNQNLVSKLNLRQLTFEEKGIDELFRDALEGNIIFTTEYQVTSMYLIAVPTPYDKFTKKIDARYVIDAVNSILQVCKKETTIIIESTVSPGTIDNLIKPLIKNNANSLGKKVHIVHAPERIIPGNMIYELEHNSRTIGADDYEIGQKVANLYRNITTGEVIVTDIKSAEMTKVVENTYRAVNIAFANELAKICNQDDMDVYEIIRICNMHPRVNILNPGPGVGGHCIPVDPWFLVGDYPSLTNIISESLKINELMPEYVLNRTKEIMDKSGLCDVTRVGIYGLTYKENVDDFRESPSLQLIERQKNHLAHALKAYDPWIKDNIVENQYHDFDLFLSEVDLVIVMVKHKHIILNMDKLKGKVVYDTQNVITLKGVHKL